MKKRLLGMVCLLLMAAGTLANSHWIVNPHAFQYDMTAYVTLALVVQSNYEVAAFCGEECRGVGKLLTAADGTQVFQLRIRSNEASGETISFKVYNSATGKEMMAENQITFEAMSVVGTPSEPLVLDITDVLKGDVNGDGKVGIGDIITITNVMAGEATDEVAKRADVNHDGEVGIGDIISITNIMAGE
jgi:hypothetical protein